MSFDGEKTDPAAEWREKVCAYCCRCSRSLAFMEGPLCDACLDAEEVRPVKDKYYGMRALQKNREDIEDLGLDYSEIPEAEKSGPRLVVRDVLAVDLSCLGRIVLHRPTPKTMDTLPVGWKAQKAR